MSGQSCVLLSIAALISCWGPMAAKADTVYSDFGPDNAHLTTGVSAQMVPGYNWYVVPAVRFTAGGASAGIGFDVTRNMGVYIGYAVTWGTWQSNPHAAISFALW